MIGVGVGVMHCAQQGGAGALRYIMDADGANLYVRGAISATKDIAQKINLKNALNGSIDLLTAYVLAKNAPNTVAAWTAGIAISSGDEMAPFNTHTNNYIGGNHGLQVPVVTSVGHDKTSADLNSIWSDGTYQFLLAAIADDELAFLSLPYQRWQGDDLWGMRTAVAGTLTHVSGAENATNAIPVTSQAIVQMRPVTQNLTTSVLANGNSEVAAGASGSAEYIDLVEEYDVVDPSTIGRSQSTFAWNVGLAWVHVKNTYRITPGGMVIHVEYQALRPFSLRTLAGIQASKITSPYPHRYYYIPKTKPTAGYDFKTRQLLDNTAGSSFWAGTINLQTSLWRSATSRLQTPPPKTAGANPALLGGGG
jgi:hypothetical protein